MEKNEIDLMADDYFLSIQANRVDSVWELLKALNNHLQLDEILNEMFFH